MDPSSRRPVAATQSHPLPPLTEVTARREQGVGQSLAVVGATGAALVAGLSLAPTHEPVCGPTRASELAAHGETIARDARAGRPGDALAELAVAMGWRAHATTQPGITGGAIAVASPVPIVPPPVPLQLPGGGQAAIDHPPMPMGAPPPVTALPPAVAQGHRHGHGDRVTPHPTGVPADTEGSAR